VPATSAIAVDDLRFGYVEHPAVAVERLRLGSGESMAVIGSSGCGKTTLLHLLAGLLRPGAGEVRVLGQDLSKLRATGLDRFRGRNIGLVFQRFHLLPALTVRENVLLAQRLAGVRLDSARVRMVLDRLGLAGLERRRPSMLSHGQAQRVAIARALVHEPRLVMADEPTSALDDHHAEEVLALLRDSVAAVGAALVIVTHDQRVRGRLQREFEMAVPT